MKTLRMKPENFDLLLQGPDVKSTTIRVGDKTKRFRVGERIDVRTNDHRAVECEVTRLKVTCGADLLDSDAWADGFENFEHLWAALHNLNHGVDQADVLTIIGLRVVGNVRDTRFEAFSVEELGLLADFLGTDLRASMPMRQAVVAELAHRNPEVRT